MFPWGRSVLFIAERFWVFFPSGIRAPWCSSDVDIVTLGTINLICYTFCIARSFLLCPTYWAVLRSHCPGLNGSDFWSNLLIAISAFSTTLILKPYCSISFWYFFCSCEFGVAGTKITAAEFVPTGFFSQSFPVLVLPFSIIWADVTVFLLLDQPSFSLYMLWGLSRQHHI